MTSYSTSAEAGFRCPVCRAKQVLAATCRRCRADLRLVERAHRRLAHLVAQQKQLLADGNHLGQQTLAAELQWLAPSRTS